MSRAETVGQLCRHFLADHGGFVALFKVYIDEGGTDENSPILTVAGYIARPSQWKLFTRDWTRVLKPTGIKVYHATDAQALEKQFKGWTGQQVGELCSRLLPIIPRYARGASVSIDMREFRAAVGHRPELMRVFSTPYNACFHWFTMSLLDWADRAGSEPKFAFVHEINDMKAQAIEGFEWVKKHSPFGNGGSLLSLSFADKDEFVPLQAADILAFEVNKRLKDQSKHPRRAWLAMQADQLVASQYYGKNNMPTLVAELEKISSLYGDLDKLERYFRAQLQAMKSRR